MSLEMDRLLNEALQLSGNERAELADQLLRSLDEGEKDEGYDEAWAAEIARRIEEADRGDIPSIPWEELDSRLKTKANDAATG
jgi:putative addiction module component (TIGR02574 family)